MLRNWDGRTPYRGDAATAAAAAYDCKGENSSTGREDGCCVRRRHRAPKNSFLCPLLLSALCGSRSRPCFWNLPDRTGDTGSTTRRFHKMRMECRATLVGAVWLPSTRQSQARPVRLRLLLVEGRAVRRVVVPFDAEALRRRAVPSLPFTSPDASLSLGVDVDCPSPSPRPQEHPRKPNDRGPLWRRRPLQMRLTRVGLGGERQGRQHGGDPVFFMTNHCCRRPAGLLDPLGHGSTLTMRRSTRRWTCAAPFRRTPRK